MIQVVTASVGRASVLRRISTVPSAHDSAAACSHSTPTGRPARADSSLAASRPTAAMADTTASHERALMRSPNSSTLISSTVHTGIVKARMRRGRRATATGR